MQYRSPDAGQKATSLLPGWSPLKSYGVLPLLLCFFASVPFIETAFHIDDPLFLWTAKQIVHHPADPYGFKVLWYTTEQPMFDVTKNPPLSSYYGAAVGKIAGWSEPAFHLAFILPAPGIVLGDIPSRSPVLPHASPGWRGGFSDAGHFGFSWDDYVRHNDAGFLDLCR